MNLQRCAYLFIFSRLRKDPATQGKSQCGIGGLNVGLVPGSKSLLRLNSLYDHSSAIISKHRVAVRIKCDHPMYTALPSWGE